MKLNSPKCRHCDTELSQTLVDLGPQPLCNTLVKPEAQDDSEMFYPLHTRVCPNCFLVQVGDFVAPDEIFSEYSYFSSFSDSFVAHAKRFVDEAIPKHNLSTDSLVIEIASNDGYLLQHFLPHNIPVLGVEPAANVGEAGTEKGVESLCLFLGSDTVDEIVAAKGKADLVVANNVMAHTPFLNDFIKSMAAILKNDGVISVEFPHVMKMLEENLYDMIYHEHFSYFSLFTVERIFRSLNLQIFDAVEVETHGGSLRISACHMDYAREETDRLKAFRKLECDSKINEIETYQEFAPLVAETKFALIEVLSDIKRQGKRIVGYGVPGKGNTLLNYCGIRTDFLDYMVDRNTYKQGNYTPGTRIPIFDVSKIDKDKPDYVLIMPWNLKNEILSQLEHIKEWGGKFIIALPKVEVIS